MKKYKLLLFFILPLMSSAQDWQWTKDIGSSVMATNAYPSIATDVAGNYLVLAGIGTYASCQQTSGSVVIRSDENGNCIRTIPLPFPSTRAGIATDLFGNYFVTGNSIDTFYLRKYNSYDSLLWVKNAVNSTGRTLTTDVNGSIYLTGFFGDTITFDTVSITENGNGSSFIAKFDSTGYCVWAKAIPGFVNGISVDAQGNSYITGRIDFQSSFDTITLTPLGGKDIFIAKFNNTGSCVWAKRAGGMVNHTNPYSHDEGYAIVATNLGHIYVTGSFVDTATFETTQLITAGGGFSNDVFVAKYTTDGNLIWVNRYGGVSDDEGFSITTDAQENCYVAGRYVFSISFGNTTLPYANNDYDLFVAKIDAGGNHVWAKGAGSTSWNDVASGIVLSTSDVTFTGIFTGPATAYFGADTFNSAGNEIFISKLSTVTGIPQSAIQNPKLSLFPNPTTTELNIQIDETLLGAQLNIYNITGALMQTATLDIQHSAFNIQQFPSGVYIAEINPPAARAGTKEASVKRRWVKM